jgi:hypothetical protein
MTTDDGRPFVRDPKEPDDDLALWMPSPVRHDDPIYCCGVVVGHFHGTDDSGDGYSNGCVCLVPTRDMPPKLAAWMRSKSSPITRPAVGVGEARPRVNGQVASPSSTSISVTRNQFCGLG